MNTRESDEDRLNQRLVKDIIENAWGVELVATRTLDPHDFVAYKGQKRKAIIEVRRRHVTKDTYDDYWISYQKYKQLRLLGEAFEVPVLFFFYFDDGLFYIDLMMYPYLPTSYGDRGDPEKPRATDNEKVVCIKKDLLKELKNG